MLQALRRNPGVSEFYFEYLKYELRFLQKLQIRKRLLEKSDMVKMLEENQEEETSKIQESVPSLVYACSDESITKAFKYDVQLHFRILSMVKTFEKEVEIESLVSLVNKHIDEVLFKERKSQVLKNLLLQNPDQSNDIINNFCDKTEPDLHSFEFLIEFMKSQHMENQHKVVLEFYKKLAHSENNDIGGNSEKASILLLNYLDSLESNSEINLLQVLKSLHEKYSESFAILVHFCKHSLLSNDYDENEIEKYRQTLATLSSAIKKRQQEGIGKK